MDVDIGRPYADLNSRHHIATSPMFLRGVGRGEWKSTDLMSIRLPKVLLEKMKSDTKNNSEPSQPICGKDQVIQSDKEKESRRCDDSHPKGNTASVEKFDTIESNNIRRSMPSHLICSKDEVITTQPGDIHNNEVPASLNLFTPLSHSSLCFQHTHESEELVWHGANMHALGKAHSFSSSSVVSSVDDTNIIKNVTDWPTMESSKKLNINSKLSNTKKVENVLNFKSIGEMFCKIDDCEATNVGDQRLMEEKCERKGERPLRSFANLMSSDKEKEESCHVNAHIGNEDCGMKGPNKSLKLCIENLPNTLTDDDLVGALSTYGTVNSCMVYRASDSCALAIVRMDCLKACEWAIACLHGEESPFPGYSDSVPVLKVCQIEED